MTEIARDPSRPPRLEVFSQIVGLPAEESQHIALALGLFLAASPADDFKAVTDQLVSFEIIESTEVAALSEALKKGWQHAPDLEVRSAEAVAASQVLQNLTGIEFLVDFRPVFEGSKMVYLVPVALCYLSTDRDESLTCQLSAGQLDRLLEKVKRAKERMDKMRTADLLKPMS